MPNLSASDGGNIIAIDQGTSSTKGLLLDQSLRVLASTTIPVSLEFPQNSWVQQDAQAIWESVSTAIEFLAEKSQEPVVGLAITNQRESALAWDTRSGEPLSAMLGWQDRRTAQRAAKFLPEQQESIRAISGLPLDPMFSALKFEWILDQIDPDRSLSNEGQIALGTVDSWLVFKLTGQHVIEAGNASRTQLLNVATGNWSDELLALFRIPRRALPQVVASDRVSAPITAGALPGKPVLAVLADSHAALYAHLLGAGVNSKQQSGAKATYGTGSSIMGLSAKPALRDSGLVTTIAWSTSLGQAGPGKLVHALEGNILASGATVVWLSQLLGKTPKELDALAQSVAANSETLNIVPAFGGLGAPWWDSQASAIVDGITLATGAPELAKAAFEAIALQIEDVVAAFESATATKVEALNVDGGPTSNNWLMQLQANLSQRRIIKNNVAELSATGVGALAFQVAGYKIADYQAQTTSFEPKIEPSQALARNHSWQAALAKSRMQGSK